MQFKTTDPACMSYSNKKIKIGSGGGDFFLLLLLCLTSIPVFAQPSIQQFSPLSAAPGSAVTIQGSGFSTTPSSNQVFFGAVKGTVTSATSNVLVATVPVGATPGPIIVMVSGLSGYSKTDFQPRSGTAFPIDGGAFSIGDTIETGYYPSHALFSDLDLDGKPDMLVLRYEPNNSSQNHIMPFKNQSIPNGKVSFNPQGSFEAGIYATDLAIGDLDGDGKQDAVVTSVGNASAEIKVLRNTSTGGSISFSNVSSWTITGVANHVATGDADGDGKIDIAVSNYLDGKLMIYRNTGSAGSISFAPAVVIEAGGSADMLAFADLNGDGKRDIAVNNNLFGRIVIFNNNSSPGSISFVQTRIIELQNAPKVENIVAADLNSDGRNDLLVTTGNLTNFNGAFLVFTNNGNFTFSSPQIVQNPDFSGSYYKPSVGDLNGDGKPDVVLGWASEARFGVYQNLSEPGGTINLQFAKDWFALSPYRVAIGDLNADEQPELAIASFTSTEGVSIFDNKMGKLTISNVSPDAAEKGTEVTISGYNFSGITSVKFGNTPAASFNVVSPNTIKAIVGDGSSGRVEVSGATGTGYWEEFIYINRPKINSFSPKIGVEGDTILINGKNFSGTYEVTFGGVSATSFTVENDSTIKAIVGNGATGDIDIYTPGGSTFINGFIYPEKPYINSLDFYEGTVGDSITIFGDNLILPGMETKVTIGGVPASIFYSRDFSLGVIIGHGASGHVAVFHKGGSDSLDGFTFIPPPSNPVINSISPMSGQPGDTILVKGMNFGGLTGIYFGDSAAAYFEVVDDSTVLAVVNNGASGNVKAVAPWGFGQFPGFTFIMPSSPVLFTISPEEGITGTLIEVSGDNLYGVVSVKMGTAIITNIKYNSRKKLGFYVPLNANGPVSVTTKYGTGVLQQPLFTIWQPPKLNSFSPLTAETGETVTINGSGFGNDASSLDVYFGDIKAKILSVQPNTINVEVPGAAGLGFIKVTARNLSVFSKNKFNRSNKNTAAYPLTETLFEKIPVYQYPETSINEHKIISADFNNDGLTDYALIYKDIVRIFKNVSTRGKVEFVEGESISLYTDFSTATANDIDCDGKTDLVMVSSYEFLRNVSTP
ncbi:MAG: IPT/TIG domain-containing protein, partial [Chitinophagaceae bacterium]|nr:IPT/TIG domain-containing protein [Chitinophagaceae bacterium]